MQYYKSAGENSEYIVILEIPSDAQTNLERKNVANSKYAKYRCSKALVVDIEHKETKQKVDYVVSSYINSFVYTLNEIIEDIYFDDNLEEVCAEGIHFFKTKKQALIYNTRPENGKYKQWHDNGQLWEECVYKDGKIEGKYKQWHDNGQLSVERVYKDGKNEGKYKQWHDNGQLWTECVYKDGKIEVNTNSGMTMDNCVYKDGKIEGKYKQWHDNGQLCVQRRQN